MELCFISYLPNPFKKKKSYTKEMWFLKPLVHCAPLKLTQKYHRRRNIPCIYTNPKDCKPKCFCKFFSRDIIVSVESSQYKQVLCTYKFWAWSTSQVDNISQAILQLDNESRGIIFSIHQAACSLHTVTKIICYKYFHLKFSIRCSQPYTFVQKSRVWGKKLSN